METTDEPKADQGRSTCGESCCEYTTPDWDRQIDPMLRRIGASDIPVLVVGETGSGKEFIARRIHALSSRAHRMFLKLNCASLPAERFERFLPGYDRGLTNTSPGGLKLPDRGTILLDEVGDLAPTLQATLLQFLEDQQSFGMPDEEPARLDVRLIATTHRDLDDLVEKGEFREDLYYRLKVLHITVPPLRNRKRDIVPLALSFLKKYSRRDTCQTDIGPELSAALVEYTWPGNVRELENTIRSYVVLKDPRPVLEQLRTVPTRRASLGVESPSSGPVVTLKSPDTKTGYETPLARMDYARRNAETQLIIQALSSALWNRKRAALALGMDYRAFLYKMKKLGIMNMTNSGSD